MPLGFTFRVPDNVIVDENRRLEQKIVGDTLPEKVYHLTQRQYKSKAKGERMNEGALTFSRIGGVAACISAGLFAAIFAIELATGMPPRNGTDILSWVSRHKMLISFSNEFLMFAVLALIPVTLALFVNGMHTSAPLRCIGASILGVSIPFAIVLLVVQGRLVYPVYGMVVDTPAAAEYTVTLFYGGLHALWLLFAASGIFLSISMVQSPHWRFLAIIGFIAIPAEIIASYPDTIGLIVATVCRAVFVVWLIVLGITLLRLHS